MTRRDFLKYSAIAGAAVCGAAIFNGVVIGPKNFKIERLTVPVMGLHPAFEGFTVCQITDVHHSPIVTLDYLTSVVQTANSLRPDLTVLTGDYIDGDRSFMAPAIKCLSALRARRGVLSILGNHDYFFGRVYTEEVLASNKIPLLKESHMIIEEGGGTLCVAGTSDFSEGRPSAEKALYGVGTEIPRVLLTHHPDYCEFLPKGVRIDLVLSGHTHGGQVRLPFSYAPVLPSRFGQKYSGGLVELGRPEGTRAYVSRGVGVAMLPVRFNCPPELTLLRLVREAPFTTEA